MLGRVPFSIMNFLAALYVVSSVVMLTFSDRQQLNTTKVDRAVRVLEDRMIQRKAACRLGVSCTAIARPLPGDLNIH